MLISPNDLDKIFTHAEYDIKSEETRFSMEEFLVPPSNDYPYELYGERKRIQKAHDGSDKTVAISILKLYKLHVLLHFST